MSGIEILRNLGLSDEQIIERVVDQITNRLLLTERSDEWGDPVATDSEFKKRLDAEIQVRIDQAVDAAAGEFAVPKIKEYLDGYILQKTNEWGEKKGEPVTFTEYLVARADAWMQEPVDMDGKTKAESRSSFWSKHTTRVAYLIDKHLQWHIDKAMKEAAKKANESIVGGIKKAVEKSLNSLRVEIKGEVE